MSSLLSALLKQQQSRFKFIASRINWMVQELFKAYTAPEHLEHLEYRCGGCHQNVKASKQLSVYQWPQVLVLHLGRFTQDFDRRSPTGLGPWKKVRPLLTKHINDLPPPPPPPPPALPQRICLCCVLMACKPSRVCTSVTLHTAKVLCHVRGLCALTPVKV